MPHLDQEVISTAYKMCCQAITKILISSNAERVLWNSESVVYHSNKNKYVLPDLDMGKKWCQVEIHLLITHFRFSSRMSDSVTIWTNHDSGLKMSSDLLQTSWQAKNDYILLPDSTIRLHQKLIKCLVDTVETHIVVSGGKYRAINCDHKYWLTTINSIHVTYNQNYLDDHQWRQCRCHTINSTHWWMNITIIFAPISWWYVWGIWILHDAYFDMFMQRNVMSQVP